MDIEYFFFYIDSSVSLFPQFVMPIFNLIDCVFWVRVLYFNTNFCVGSVWTEQHIVDIPFVPIFSLKTTNSLTSNFGKNPFFTLKAESYFAPYKKKEMTRVLFESIS